MVTGRSGLSNGDVYAQESHDHCQRRIRELEAKVEWHEALLRKMMEE
jgi:hypothetical protein